MNHINSKVVLGLGAAALIAVAAASLISGNRKPVAEAMQAGAFALPALRGQVNDVKDLVLTGAENKALVTLSRGDRGWAVKEKGGYPADSGKLREVLLKLADAALLEQKTASEQRYPELGVEDTKAKDTKGIKISLVGLPKPEQLIVGSYSAKMGGTFVRRPDDKQSWLAKGNLTPDRDPVNWLDKTIADIGPDRISEILLTKPGGKALRLYKERQGDADFKVADLPPGKEISSPSTVNGLASTLSGLNLLDVVPTADIKEPGDGEVRKASFRTFDGLKVDMSTWQQDAKNYARFTAVLEQAKAEAQIQAAQAKAKAKADFESKPEADPKENPPPSVADPAKDREQRLADLANEVASLTRRFDGSTFVIPPYKSGNMDKSLDELLKPAATRKPENGKADARQAGAKKTSGGKD